MNGPEANPELMAVAQAVAAGLPVEWTSAESSVSDPTLRAIVRELKVVADIAEVHSTLADADSEPSVWDSLAQSGVSGEAVAEAAPDRRLPSWGSLLLIERVGRGTFGEIYRAWDQRLHREVALKLLRPRAAGERDSVGASVVEEGRLLARVQHPNVVRVYGADRIEGRVGVWMEFVRGRTLERVLRDQGPFSSHEAMLLGRDVCRALSAVHHAGLLHRDVKAHNVMREDGGRIVLMDFGTGRESGEADAAERSDLAGTPLYMAPEVLAMKAASPASDLYSVGVLLFHLATGSYPVSGRAVDEIRQAHETGTRAYLRDLRPESDAAFAEVVERALDPDPARRFASAGHMERALNGALARQADESASAMASDAVSAGSAPPPASWQRRAYRLAFASLLVAAAAIVMVFRSGMFRTVPPAGRTSSGLAAPAVQTQRTRRIPTPEPGYTILGRPSPDGRLFSFVDLNSDLAVFDTATGAQRRLTNKRQSNEGAYWHSTFSADGKYIAYTWRALDGAVELRVSNADGSWPRVVLQRPNEYAGPIEWSRDGKRILTLFEQEDGARRLAIVSAADGRVQPVTALDARNSLAGLSPDGRYVVFDKAQQDGAFERDILLAPVDPPGPPIPFITGERDDFAPMWTRDGTRVVFVSDRTGEPSLWSVPVTDGVPGAPTMVHRNVGGIEPIAITTNGSLFYELRIGLIDAYTATMDFETGKVVDAPKAVAPSRVGSNTAPNWSPDGRFLAFVTLPHGGSASGPRRLNILDLGNGGTRTLVPPLSSYTGVRWSPDGRAILVIGQDLKSRPGLYLVDVETGAARAVAVADERTPPNIGSLQWGPDARTVWFTRRNVGLMSRNIDTGVETPVFRFAAEGIDGIQGGVGFHLAPDGRSVAYSAHRKTADGKTEYVLRVKEVGGATRDLVPDAAIQAWTVDGQHLLFATPVQMTPTSGVTRALWIVPARGGAPRKLALELPNLNYVSVHPDGRRITFTAGFPSLELWALDHFLSASQ